MVIESNIRALVQLNVNALTELSEVVARLPQELYTAYNHKGQATIGQHVRHTLEFFDCLFEGNGVVNYDLRKRDLMLETEPLNALETIKRITARVEIIETDPEITLVTELPTVSQIPLQIASSLGRELFYVLEHAIHHMALMRIMIKDLVPDFDLTETFGVAYSTLAYRAGS